MPALHYRYSGLKLDTKAITKKIADRVRNVRKVEDKKFDITRHKGESYSLVDDTQQVLPAAL